MSELTQVLIVAGVFAGLPVSLLLWSHLKAPYDKYGDWSYKSNYNSDYEEKRRNILCKLLIKGWK